MPSLLTLISYFLEGWELEEKVFTCEECDDWIYWSVEKDPAEYISQKKESESNDPPVPGIRESETENQVFVLRRRAYF